MAVMKFVFRKTGLVVGGRYENNLSLPYPTWTKIYPPPKRSKCKEFPKQHFNFQSIKKIEDWSKLYYYQFCDINTDQLKKKILENNQFYAIFDPNGTLPLYTCGISCYIGLTNFHSDVCTTTSTTSFFLKCIHHAKY